MGRSRSPRKRSERKRSERKRSRSRERKRCRSTSSTSDSDHHKRRRDKKSSGHRRRSRSRSRERHSKHHKRHRSHDRQRRRSESPPPVKEKSDGKDLKEDPASNLTGAEKVRVRLKMLMDQQDKKKKEEEQAKLEKVLTIPSAKQIASIDKEGFHQQQFKSAPRTTTATKGKEDKNSSQRTLFPVTSISEQDHDSAIFGSKDTTVGDVSKPTEEKKPEPTVISTTQLPSSEKKAKWLEKLNKMRSKYPKPPSDEPTESLT